MRFLDQIFLKPAQCGVGTNWHTDNAYFKTPIATEGTGLWIALHDAHKENGTMMVIPKSHLKSYPHVRDMGSDHHITCANEIDPAEAELVNVPAGGCIFFNYGVVHATGDNKTHRERAGLAYHFATPKAATQSEWYHTPNNSDMYLVCGEGEGTDLALSNRDVDLSIWK